MGISNFIKKIFRENKPKEVEKEKIGFPEIRKWIDKKRKEFKTKEEKAFGLINEKIEVFNNEVKKNLLYLSGINRYLWQLGLIVSYYLYPQ